VRENIDKDKYLYSEYWSDPPADPDVLARLVEELGVDLPIDYLDFRRLHNGGEFAIGNNCLIFWKAEELSEINRDYEVQESAPGIFIFGGNGGGEAYGFFTLQSPMPVVIIPFITMDLEDAIPVAESFLDLFRRLAVSRPFDQKDLQGTLRIFSR
jgi:hypothetical protein